ncbi:hypothetical protein C2L64_46150 [Paraburkholderia hospita]|uniref:Uncharacterized protein n=1 Tax=Paraburkholderia hospita TaxID=169430 RepID=A0AAN1JKG3_9BURK|nr:hypothetical protein [Paraburkholderia hospita]AUT75718.1 hypothetical protein C2L64_46150 [Paraburkholderia hospita]
MRLKAQQSAGESWVGAIEREWHQLRRRAAPTLDVENFSRHVPGNADRFGDYMVKWGNRMLDVADDASIQGLLKDALHTVFDKLDVSKSTGAILDTLTKDGRHRTRRISDPTH